MSIVNEKANEEDVTGSETKDIKIFYNTLAEKTADEWYELDTLVPTIEEFLSLLPAKPKVLDLGCGPGYESMRLEARGAEVVGIDFCEENIRIAQERCPKCHFKLMDFRELDSWDGKFDGVFASASLIHINPEDMHKVMKNISGVLNKNGYLLVIIRDGVGVKDGGITLENGTKLNRNIYLYPKDSISEIAGKYGLNYIKSGHLDKELSRYNWQCHIFIKQQTEAYSQSI